jgi:hypothetical protein
MSEIKEPSADGLDIEVLRHESAPALAQDLPVEFASDVTLHEAMTRLAASDNESALVREDGEVIGVFALRRLGDMVHRQRFPKSGDAVEGWVTAPQYYRPEEPTEALIKRLTRSGVVLLGDPSNVTGVITLRAVAEFAHPFLLLADIERVIRDAIAALVPADERGPTFAAVLADTYGRRPPPNSVDGLTIGDYRSLLTHPLLADRVRPAFGAAVGPRIDKIGDLRNSLFHFRAALTLGDLDYLEDQRRWFRARFSRIGRERLPPAPAAEAP